MWNVVFQDEVVGEYETREEAEWALGELQELGIQTASIREAD